MGKQTEMDSADNTKKALRKFFKVTTAVFQANREIQNALGCKVLEHKMEQLHRKALVEIGKDKPNMLLIDELLDEMEKVAGC
ncbi:MAG: hypothetical protein LC664_16705 [Flavobacteriales bacterium]|nr:hypothetical protein [Flavobacteriales bacterium]